VVDSSKLLLSSHFNRLELFVVYLSALAGLIVSEGLRRGTEVSRENTN
jgi:hypothetical protein